MRKSSRVSYDPDQPPRDHVFVPTKDVYLSRNCRCISYRVKRPIHQVYDPHTKEKLGLHCNAQVFEAVKNDAAISPEHHEKALMAKDSPNHRRLRRTLRTTFPSMPEDSVEEIMNHEFFNDSSVPSPARFLDQDIQLALAVDAHIRYKFTAYDSILCNEASSKQHEESKLSAREQVDDQVQKMVNSWRPDPRMQDSVANNLDKLLKSKHKRKARGKPHLSMEEREEKAAGQIRSMLQSGAKINPKKPLSDHYQENALEQALTKLEIGGKGTEKGQRRRAGLREALEKLKRGYEDPIAATRLKKILSLHERDGGDITTLGIDVEKHIAATKQARREKKEFRRSRRECWKMKQLEGANAMETTNETPGSG
ncbi:hypothetical protein ACLMJK_002508 [Lecanora helva]